jgi:hypothetical protein
MASETLYLRELHGLDTTQEICRWEERPDLLIRIKGSPLMETWEKVPTLPDTWIQELVVGSCRCQTAVREKRVNEVSSALLKRENAHFRLGGPMFSAGASYTHMETNRNQADLAKLYRR